MPYLRRMETKIKINQLGNDKQFQAENENGVSVLVDGTEEKKGMRPMELLLSALGTCSAFDAVDILKKQRQKLASIDLVITGKRPAEGYPKPYKSVHFDVKISGEVELEKANRALELSIEKYCSVKESLNPHIPVTFSVEINKQ